MWKLSFPNKFRCWKTSGVTDTTCLETVTESTKETSFLSSYTSDIDKTVAVDETIDDSTAATMGSTFAEKVFDEAAAQQGEKQKAGKGVELEKSLADQGEEIAGEGINSVT